MLHIVLVEPEIPANTGNIARTCAATGSVLHLVKPLGFDISDKAVKRAGLDYWHLVDVRVYEDLDEFFAKNQPACMRLFSTKAPRRYDEADYPDGTYLFFGKETKGPAGGVSGCPLRQLRPPPHPCGGTEPQPQQFRRLSAYLRRCGSRISRI